MGRQSAQHRRAGQRARRPQAAARGARVPGGLRQLPEPARHDAADPVWVQRRRRVRQPRLRAARHDGARRRASAGDVPDGRAPAAGAHAGPSRGHARRSPVVAAAVRRGALREPARRLPLQRRAAQIPPVGAHHLVGLHAPRGADRGRPARVRQRPDAVRRADARRASERAHDRTGDRVRLLPPTDGTRRHEGPRRAVQRGVDRPVGRPPQTVRRAHAPWLQADRAHFRRRRDRAGDGAWAPRPWHGAGRLVPRRATGRLGAQALDARDPRRRPAAHAEPRHRRRLDGRHPALPPPADPDHGGNDGAARFAVGHQRHQPGAVLEGPRLRRRLR